MRKAVYQGSEDEGRALLARTREVHLAMVSETGAPILRTFDTVVDDGFLAFHGAPAGQKMEGVLAALMTKYQPEGRDVPLAPEHALYRKAIAGLLVARIRLDRVTCKAKLGQNRQPAGASTSSSRCGSGGRWGTWMRSRSSSSAFPSSGRLRSSVTANLARRPFRRAASEDGKERTTAG